MTEQLQDILNKCIENGWKPFGIERESKSITHRAYNIMRVDERGIFHGDDTIPMYSFHDLFSKDSGLMEFVKWKNGKEYTINMRDDPYDRVAILSDGTIDCRDVDSHYMTMSTLIAEQKISYFLANALI